MTITGHSEGWPINRRSRPFIISAFAFILISSIILLTGPVEEASGQPSRMINVAYFENRPLCYRVGDGELTGLSVDLLRSIAEEEDWDLEFTEGTRDECRSWLADGSVDIVVGMEETLG